MPLRDDRALFELLILEGAQAGLSWRTILHKRENYRRAFAGFDPAKVARFGARERKRLLADAGIVRNRLKIDAAIGNAQAWLRLREEEGGAVDWLWSFVGGKPIVSRRRAMGDVPARTAESDALAKALKKRGFRFVGSTICYAFMQAAGLVDDHFDGCWRRARARR